MALVPLTKLLLAGTFFSLAFAIDVDGTCHSGEACDNAKFQRTRIDRIVAQLKEMNMATGDTSAFIQSTHAQVLMAQTTPIASSTQLQKLDHHRSKDMLELNKTVSDIKKIVEAGQTTPEVATMIQDLIDMIHNELQTHIMDDQNDAQSAVDSNIADLTAKTDSAVDAKHEADQFDMSHDQCVTTEKLLLEAHENCKIEEAALLVEKESEEYCANAAFDIAYHDPPQLPTTLTVDFSKGLEHVKNELDAYLTPLINWVDAQKDQAVIDQDKWDAAHLKCTTKTQELTDKTAECGVKLENWRSQRVTCTNAAHHKKLSFCAFGHAYQAKCASKNAYDTRRQEIEGSGTIWSEPDREDEWTQTTKLTCVLSTFKSTTELTTGAVTACTKTDAEAALEFTQDVTRIDHKNATYDMLTSQASFTCAEADITFASGVLWTVPEWDGGAVVPNSAGYTKETGYKYAIESGSSAAPFEFCLCHSAHAGAPTCGASFDCSAEPGEQKDADTKCYMEGGCTTADCCVRMAVCGDHVVETNEACDDGNKAAGDGCSASCTAEAICTVPSIASTMVQGWTGANCASGSDNVFEGTDCQITAATGHTCTSPGVCGANGHFAATGECHAIVCGADHKVVSHVCTTCPDGKTSTGNHDASGEDTSCNAKYCGPDEKVVDHTCQTCPAGKTSSGDHDASLGNTECEEISLAMRHFGGTGCHAGHICTRCQGDCDYDADCTTGLKCFQRDGFTKIVGCDAGGSGDISGHDYCYDPELSLAMRHFGGTGCHAGHICTRCEGDCDYDADCTTGLKCFQRNGFTSIPGCDAGGSGDISDHDYCYDPEA